MGGRTLLPDLADRVGAHSRRALRAESEIDGQLGAGGRHHDARRPVVEDELERVRLVDPVGHRGRDEAVEDHVRDVAAVGVHAQIERHASSP